MVPATIATVRPVPPPMVEPTTPPTTAPATVPFCSFVGGVSQPGSAMMAAATTAAIGAVMVFTFLSPRSANQRNPLGKVVAVERAKLVLDLQEAHRLLRGQRRDHLLGRALAQLLLICVGSDHLLGDAAGVGVGHRRFAVHVVEHRAVLLLHDAIEVA